MIAPARLVRRLRLLTCSADNMTLPGETHIAPDTRARKAQQTLPQVCARETDLHLTD